MPKHDNKVGPLYVAYCADNDSGSCVSISSYPLQLCLTSRLDGPAFLALWYDKIPRDDANLAIVSIVGLRAQGYNFLAC